MMTDAQKVAKLKGSYEIADTASDAVLLRCIEDAEGIVLNQMYPFGYEDGIAVPTRYERIQIRIASELFSRIGAEGESNHDENGVTRAYDTGFLSPSLLRQILPCASVVYKEEADSDETSSA